MSMEAEYDAILSEDFHGPEHVSLSDTIEQQHEQQQQQHQHDQQLHILDPAQDGLQGSTPEPSPRQDEGENPEDQHAEGSHTPDAKSDGKEKKRPLSHLTPAERRERQKAQNRKAAERARSKKREDLGMLEQAVATIREENARLRVRLSELLASRNSSAPPDPAVVESTPSSSNATGLDYAYLGKIQNELASAKSTLLERELELARLKGAETSADVDVLRHLLLSHHTTLTSLKAEAGSLEAMIANLGNERKALAEQAEYISRELIFRKRPRRVHGDGDVDLAAHGGSGGTGVERALLDIRGMVDEAVRSWEQDSILPGMRDGEDVVHGNEGDGLIGQ